MTPHRMHAAHADDAGTPSLVLRFSLCVPPKIVQSYAIHRCPNIRVSENGLDNISRLKEVEYQHRDLVFLAQGERRLIHYPQALLGDLLEGKAGVALGMWVLVGI